MNQDLIIPWGVIYIVPVLSDFKGSAIDNAVLKVQTYSYDIQIIQNRDPNIKLTSPLALLTKT